MLVFWFPALVILLITTPSSMSTSINGRLRNSVAGKLSARSRLRTGGENRGYLGSSVQGKGVDLGVLKISDEGIRVGSEDFGPHMSVNFAEDPGFSAGINTGPLGGSSAEFEISGDGFETSGNFFHGNKWDASVGPEGVQASGEVSLLGVIGASGKAGCTPDGCYGDGYAWHDEECANFWKRQFSPPVQLPAFKMKPIVLQASDIDVLRKASQSVMAALEGAGSGAKCATKSMGNPSHLCLTEGDCPPRDEVIFDPGQFVECLDREGLTEAIIAPVCSALHDSVIIEQATEVVAEMASFGGSCLDGVLPGIGDFTKAFTASVDFGVTVGDKSFTASVGLALSFAKENHGLTVDKSSCFVAGSFGQELGMSIGAGVSFSAGLWKSYDSIAGRSLTFAMDMDFCDIFGLPCDFSLGTGICATFNDEAEREDLVRDLKRCMPGGRSSHRTSADLSVSTGIPNPIRSDCFGGIKGFLDRTQAILLSVAVGTGTPTPPVGGTFSVDYTSNLIGAYRESSLTNWGVKAEHYIQDTILEYGSKPCQAMRRLMAISEVNATQALNKHFVCSTAEQNCAFGGICISTSGSLGQCSYPQEYQNKADQLLAFDKTVGELLGACQDYNMKYQKKSWPASIRLSNNWYRKDPAVGGWGGTCTCPDGSVYAVGDAHDSCASLACDGGVSSSCEKVFSPDRQGMRVTCATGKPEENWYRYNPNVGSWGGTCRCPDGHTYQVGDNNDSCASLACEGGVSSSCERVKRKERAGMSATCAPGH